MYRYHPRIWTIIIVVMFFNIALSPVSAAHLALRNAATDATVYTLSLSTSGAGKVATTPMAEQYTAGTIVQLYAAPSTGALFLGWTVDGTDRGWAPSLTVTMDTPHTIGAAFVPRSTFGDTGDDEAIVQLAARGIVRGYQDGRFGPQDTVLRAQIAAFICRSLAWEGERHPNPFSDQQQLDENLWSDVGTLAARSIARGYADGTYRPTEAVIQAQAISFIARAMAAAGQWQAQPDAPALYPELPASSGHQGDLATYVHYAGLPPATSADRWDNWSATATRRWFAQALWQALSSIGGASATSVSPTVTPTIRSINPVPAAVTPIHTAPSIATATSIPTAIPRMTSTPILTTTVIPTQTSTPMRTSSVSTTATPTWDTSTRTPMLTATPTRTSTSTATVIPTQRATARPSSTPTPLATSTPAPTTISTATPLPTRNPTVTITPLPSPDTSGFVGRQGTQFTLDGQPFRFVGFNLFDAAATANYQCGWWARYSDDELDAALGAMKKQAGANVLRFWAFQSYTAGGTDWSGIDKVLRLARKHNIKVIPVLENGPGHCGNYGSAKWEQGDVFYRNASRRDYTYGSSLSLPDYIDRIVGRYKDDPTIMAWMIMNEADTGDKDGLYTFAAILSAQIKTLDSRHLVTLGTQSNGVSGSSGSDFIRLYGLPTLDFAEGHDYAFWGSDTDPLPGSADGHTLPDPRSASCLSTAYIPNQAKIACSIAQAHQILGKPYLIGEAGIGGGNGVAGRQRRADRIGAKMDAFFANGGSGYIVWQWNRIVDTEGFDVLSTLGDPLLPRMKSHADTFAAQR